MPRPCEDCGQAPAFGGGSRCPACQAKNREAKREARANARALELTTEKLKKKHERLKRKYARDNASPARQRAREKFKAKQRAEREATSAERSAKREAAKQQLVVSEAERELAMRVLARRRFMPFVLRFKPDYKAGWVHREIAKALEWFSDEIAAERSPRLIITLPPRAGKSELVSANFPAWHLGRHPTHEVIACSHTASLAEEFSRRVRDLLRDPGYTSTFPTRLSTDSQSIARWSTTAGGGYMAAGVGGPLVGRGANCLIIDDPVKNKEEADSARERDALKAWYATVAYTRLAPGGGVLLMLQRWHEDDLAGWQIAMQSEGGDQWRVLNFPAIATEDETYRKKGEALHPERYDLKALMRIKRLFTTRDWEALYQQNPVPEEGEYFKLSDFVFYPRASAPKNLRVYAAWDLAIGLKESNDWSVGAYVGIDEKDDMWLLDIRRGRWDAFQLVEQILDGYEQWHPDVTGIEKGQIELAIGPILEKRMRERKLSSMYYEPLPPGRRDKFSRARSIQGRMRQGKVHFPDPKETPWMPDVMREMTAFGGGGTHDDIVDAMAWIGLLITEIAPPPPVKTEKKEGWRDKLKIRLRGGAARSAMTA